MDNQIFHFVFIIIAGVILADMVANPAGTTALFGGFRKLLQIMTNPTNTNGL